MHGFHHVANGCDALNQLLFSDYEGRSNFEHHKVVTADLRENVPIPEEPHHEDLAEQSRMDRIETLRGT
jgi:hypothetical protein